MAPNPIQRNFTVRHIQKVKYRKILNIKRFHLFISVSEDSSLQHAEKK